MKSILMTAFCAAVLQFVSCSNQVKNVKSALISADEAKEIVAKEFEESDYHQQYYVGSSDSRSLLDSDDASGFVFVDPWQNIEKSNGDSISNTDAYFSKFNINHRAYKIKSCGKNRSAADSDSKFEPVD